MESSKGSKSNAKTKSVMIDDAIKVRRIVADASWTHCNESNLT